MAARRYIGYMQGGAPYLPFDPYWIRVYAVRDQAGYHVVDGEGRSLGLHGSSFPEVVLKAVDLWTPDLLDLKLGVRASRALEVAVK